MADVNGLGSMVSDCECGISVPTEDHVSLSSAIEEVALADESTRTSWGSSGMEASREYQWDRVTDRVLDVYRRSVG